MRLVSCPQIARLLSASRRAFSSAPVVTSKARVLLASAFTHGQLPRCTSAANPPRLCSRLTSSPQVFFDVSIGGAPAGRVSIGLFGNDVPKVIAMQRLAALTVRLCAARNARAQNIPHGIFVLRVRSQTAENFRALCTGEKGFG